MTYTHKLTGQKMLLKKDYNGVSTLYQLDGEGNKIPNGINVHGEKAYLTAVCNNENLI